ncbi:TonB-dependent receptor plug domain-containing protein [Sphingomonas mollis]|uniref:TonB-dependent receptor n=1 Tax=Sphingomonas mollis TaxID=2795726 RepID=A0ABS0XJW8_9SPHN|nr:TonB-dependent receptor [Sphingomonas sp. BT553]MBJ6120322.1 TonB-dependent receptor [Sphingomonas sp. BT553]
MTFGRRCDLAVRTSIISLAVASFGLATGLQAQTAPTPTQAPVDAAPTAADVATPSDEAGDTEIVVTGSRIARPELDSPTPVTSYSAATLQQSGRVNVTDFLAQTPALIGSSTSAQQSGSTGGFGQTGVNLLNLRNLGTARTLVLVDGRRHVAGLPGSASVDINTIPADLIDRIDVTTGGASAIYGADGVSGVVNFVLKRNFEGLVARGQTGISEDGDAGNRYFSITGGKNFAGGRGNIALNYEFRDDDRVNSFDRARSGDPLQSFGIVRDPNDFPDDASRFDRVLTNNLRYADTSRGGAVDLDLDGIPDFNGNGTPYDRGRNLPGTGLVQGGDSTPLAGYQGDLQPKNRIHNVNLLTSFEVSPALRLFAQGKYTNTKSFTVAQPSFDFFTYLAPDNAFLIDRFGSAAASNGALVSRDNFDLGVRGESTKRETYRGVIGADGRISDHARYELSYVYGRTDSTFLSTNYRIRDRYFAALDAVRNPATGQVVCRSNLTPGANIDPNNLDEPATTFTPGANSGCQPLNILGEGSPSAAALSFINADLVNTYKVQQHVASGSISGDFGQFFELPGGPIGFAVGGEYRKESSAFVSDPLSQAGALADLAQILPEKGSFDVKEAFGELRIPLLSKLPFAETLEFNAAVRLSDYSTVGRTTTWQLSGIWAPIRDIRIRGGYSEAVRAPNITELFSPTNGTFSFIDDPCDPENVPEGTSFRAANCRAALTAAGLSPTQIAAFNPVNDPTATVSLPGRAGGNRDLSEETAKTWTAGVVLQPRFLSGLMVTADWYNIKLTNAVNTPTAQQLVDLCVDQPTLDNVYCTNITRSGTTGYVSDYLVGPQNVAAFRTQGLDLVVNYRLDAGSIGAFNARVVGNYLDRLDFVPTPGADRENQRLLSNLPAPKYSGIFDLTWSNGPVTLNYGINYYSKTRRYTEDQVRANPDIAAPEYLFFREKWEHDLQASIAPNDRYSFYVGVNNLTGKEGDVASNSIPYSFVGRYFYAGARIALDKLF